ncbi:MAG: proton-conducting transporter membrane subunit, partial [Pirellulales bacterium]
MQDAALVLSLVIFLPAAGALALAFFPREKEESVRLFSLAVTIAVFLITAWMAIPGTGDNPQFHIEPTGAVQSVVVAKWIPALGVEYFLGVDGISFPLVILTSFLSVLSMWASWSITKHVKGFCILFLLLETGMLGVFLALDFFLFFVFWEVMLLPMYFLIGVWGGPRREYAAFKFFLYTMLGGVCMVVAIVMLYFASDLGELSTEQLEAAHVQDPDGVMSKKWLAAAGGESDNRQHTFNILALQQMGQHTKL